MTKVEGRLMVTRTDRAFHYESKAMGADACKRRIEDRIASLKWWERLIYQRELERMRDDASDLALTLRRAKEDA